MSDAVVQRYLGIDLRRSIWTSQFGTLRQLNNGIVNQGSEVEKRMAFVKTLLPANTFGLLATTGTLLTFGSISAPTMPSGFTYQRLQSPLGGAMTAFVGASLFNGQAFVLATFGTDGTYAFYNGSQVLDFTAGEVLTGFTTTAEQAANLVALINSTTNYTAAISSPTNTVIITGENASDYGVTSIQSSASGTIETIQISTSQPGSGAIKAIGTFTIIAGAAGTGTLPFMNQIAISNGGNALTTQVPWTGDATSFATAVASQVNSDFNSNGGYSALSSGATVTVYAPVGSSYNNLAINPACQPSSNHDGQILLSACVFTINTPAGGTITISNIASANDGNIDTTSRSSTSFASINDFLTQVATDLTTTSYASNWGAVAIGSQLFVGLNFSQSPGFGGETDTITVTFTATGGTTISGTNALLATATPSSAKGTAQVFSAGAATVVSNSVKITASGGIAPYSFSWQISSPSIFINVQSTSTASFSAALSIGDNQVGNSINNTATGTATCTVTDSNGSITTVLVPVRLSVIR